MLVQISAAAARFPRTDVLRRACKREMPMLIGSLTLSPRNTRIRVLEEQKKLKSLLIQVVAFYLYN